jgi:asparagine synthase (glutamine-hydrolysing)
MYCIVRITDNPSQLELLTDIIGMEQVFYFHKDGLWLISNSVYLIERIIGHVALDPLGISLFLSIGWVGDDRTLLSNIRVIPGGQLWTWKEGDNEPNRQSYYKPSRLARQPCKKLTSSYFQRLADDLTRSMRILSQSFDNIICALTGGRDTRLVASLLIHAGLKAQYYTFGEQSGTDAKIAKQIAETFDLSYKLICITASDVIRNWDKIWQQVILQSDGMGTIDLIPAVLANPSLCSDRLCVDLGGTGGEVARGGIDDTPDFKLLFNRYDIAGMQNYLVKKWVSDSSGFIRREGIELGRDYIDRFVAQYLDEGFAPVDIPNVFFLYSRVRRKRGTNKRVQMQFQDFFSPCISRAYIEAAFAMSALQRYSEPLHYNLIRLLPELHRLPFDKYPWFYQIPVMNLIYFYYKDKILSRVRQRISNTLTSGHKSKKLSIKPHTATDMFDHMSWFEAKREQVREFCLDKNDSLIWNFVNRSVFEKITSPATDPAELSQYKFYIPLFFKIETLFHYESSMNNHS